MSVGINLISNITVQEQFSILKQLPGSNRTEASEPWRVAELKLVSASHLKLILQNTVFRIIWTLPFHTTFDNVYFCRHCRLG